MFEPVTIRVGQFWDFYLRPKGEPAHDFYKYNTPLDALKFILSLKPVDDQTYICISAICEW